MEGLKYVATFEGVSVSVAQDLFELLAPSDAAVQILEIVITQDASETSEQLPFQIARLTPTVTSGSGGTVPTPRPLMSGAPAAGSTVEANNTTRATTTGTTEVLRRVSEKVLNGFHFLPTPETTLFVSPGDTLIVGLEDAPSAALTMSGMIVFSEIGG